MMTSISSTRRLKPLKKAADFEQQISGFRTLVLALGRYGITEQQIGGMSREELNAYTDALARLNGHKTGQTTTRTTHTVKSMRRRKSPGQKQAAGNSSLPRT